MNKYSNIELKIMGGVVMNVKENNPNTYHYFIATMSHFTGLAPLEIERKIIALTKIQSQP